MSLHPGAILSFLCFALLVGWAFWRWSRRSVDPPGVLAVKLVLSAILVSGAVWCMLRIHPLIGVPAAAVCGILTGALWGRNIGNWLVSPLSSLYDGGDEEPEAKPFYAIAQAHRKQARYAEAIQEIDRQLERFPGDVEGLLLLAEIRGRHLGDWTAAAAAIDEIVANEELAVPTRAKALQALADWHLDHANNGPAARALFQRIIDLFPGTAEARQAAQRIAHASDDAWIQARHTPATLTVRPTDPRLGLRAQPPEPAPEQDPELEADALRRQLSAHPLDTEARERLAILYADRMGRLDWAVGELERLLAQPNPAAKSSARWLHLLADLHIRCAGDEPAARAALGRIVDMAPNSALAANARSRLDHLRLEMRAKAGTRRLRPRDDTGDSGS